MFGQLVRMWRRRRGWTQEELAEQAGLSVRSVRDLESGRIGTPRPTTVRQLADAFGLAPADRESFLAVAGGLPPEPAEQAGPPIAELADGAGAPGPRQTRLVPRQLPADVATFTGRAAHLHQLDELLSRGEAGTGTVISAIAGAAGIGKTALAVHWAHQVAHLFPDGQLFVNLRGFDPDGVAVDPAVAVRGFLDALQVPHWRIPTDQPAQLGLYRTLLADRRMLLVLDNARDTEQVLPLLPGAAGCLVLVTSRDRLSSLVVRHGAQPLVLGLLSAAESRQLLGRRLDRGQVKSEPEAVDDIIDSCARLPLALAIVAARAATHPQFPLASLASELRQARGGLDAFAGDDPLTDVRAVFSWSYRQLTEPAARLFRLLASHPGPDLSAAAAASLAGAQLREVRRQLTELTRVHLLTEHLPGRYNWHDLLRAYATELAAHTDPEAARRGALHRVLDHYLHTACAAAGRLYPHEDAICPDPPGAGVTPEQIEDREQAQAWFVAERRVLLAAVERADTAGFDTHTWQLGWALGYFFHQQGSWYDQPAVRRAALRAAQRCGDLTAQAYAHFGLGNAYSFAQLGRYGDAIEHFQRALELFEQVGDVPGQARTLANIAWTLGEQKRHREALGPIRAALERYRSIGHLAGQASTLNGIAWCHTLLGEHREALHHAEQSLDLLQRLGDRYGEAQAWDSIGHARQHLGEQQEALECYQRALELFGDLDDRYFQADVLTHMGDAYHATGARAKARDAWQRALAFLDELDHPNAAGLRAKLG